jgi:hypothetical protein
MMTSKRLLILDTPEHVDSENIKLKIGHHPLLYQLFSKRDFLLNKMCQKLTDFCACCGACLNSIGAEASID